jgi:hypothetical protein
VKPAASAARICAGIGAIAPPRCSPSRASRSTVSALPADTSSQGPSSRAPAAIIARNRSTPSREGSA